MAWLGTWAKRIKLTIDQGDIDDALSDFPILVYLSTSSGRNSKDVSCVFDELTEDANRKKIAVTKSDGVTQCYVEIEKWDDANEQAWLWVKVPNIASDADTDLYLYYDKTKANNTDYVDDPNSTPAENVWGANCIFISHMRDDPDNQHIRDSSDNNNDGTKGAAGEPTEGTAEVMGGVQDYDGDNDYITCPDNAELRLGASSFTVSQWVKLSVMTAFTIQQGAWEAGVWQIYINISNGYLVWRMQPSGVLLQLYFEVDVTDDEWHFLEAGQDIAGEIIWVSMDGAARVEMDISGETPSSHTGSVVIGSAGTTYCPTGKIALTKVYTEVLSAAWIKASYESERDDLLDFGSEERELPLILVLGDYQARKIGSQHILSGAIISDLIAVSAVGTQHLAASAVTSSKIASGAVGIPHIYPGAITSAKIGALAVGTPHIAALAITSGKVASGGLSPLTSGKIWAGFTGNMPREEDKPAAVPSGIIAMWHGTIANIPSGYVICDGNNSTPNLLAKFVEGVATAATNPGATGGATGKTTVGHGHSAPTCGGASATDTASRVAGTTFALQHTHSIGGAPSNTDTIADIRPLFYDIAFIMKT